VAGFQTRLELIFFILIIWLLAECNSAGHGKFHLGSGIRRAADRQFTSYRGSALLHAGQPEMPGLSLRDRVGADAPTVISHPQF
jgi:hypothetical protein